MYNKLKNIVPHKIKIDNFSAKLLSKDDLLMVQRFLENNSDFFIMSSGSEPAANEAEELFNLLPENKTMDDKFWIGLFDGENMIAFIDVVQNYKNEGEWSIGLYIVDKNYRGRSIATNLLNSFENLLLSLKAKSMKVVVQEQNSCGLPFWKKMGFAEEERRNQKYFPEKHEFIMSKKLEKKELTIEEKYFKNGKLASFPSKPDEQQEIYKIMKNWFESGKKYSEIEINNIIKSKIECRDHVTLRRDMVDNHYLNRSGDGKEYWI